MEMEEGPFGSVRAQRSERWNGVGLELERLEERGVFYRSSQSHTQRWGLVLGSIGQRTGKKAKKCGLTCERRLGLAGKIVKMGKWMNRKRDRWKCEDDMEMYIELKWNHLVLRYFELKSCREKVQ
jgi:type IV secretory pathway TraG/TraD family ATPase VirD4